ncbi:very short patch repair endonuclease [Propionicimonas sp. T2.31MG-18]|uniref:very short patch repair endonuclease n=1 Tax=Propionicimonas sp. T2.31MG-18 TaxID=3157620 RepID=UPI003671F722
MRTQGRFDTLPELAVRGALFSRGLRYRKQLPVPGMPRRTIDIAFTRIKVAVFVDGCFWHGCPQHAVSPKNNAAWWEAKLQKNRQRDEETNAYLTGLGWLVVRVWEHEDPVEAVDRISSAVQARRRPLPQASSLDQLRTYPG